MTAIAPRHARVREPSPLAEFFRRVMRLTWRRPPVPAAPSAGAATALIDYSVRIEDPEAPRFNCCQHCGIPSACDPGDAHPAACSDGCNRRGAVALPSILAADPSMSYGDALALHEIATGHDLLTDAELAALHPVAATGPQVWAVRYDGVIHVTGDNAVEVYPGPPVSWWPGGADTTASIPAVDDDAEIVYHRTDHDELDVEFDDNPPRTVLERVLAGLEAL